MQTTGLFTVHRVGVKLKSYQSKINLYTFGDVHRSSSLCNVDSWHKFLEGAKREPGLKLFLGMGDYDDFASTSERAIIYDGRIHESTADALERMQVANLNLLCKEMAFMEGHLIGLLDGNHYGAFNDGTTTTQRMCQKLKCKYLGSSAFIRLSLDIVGHRLACDIWAHHGKGASRLAGSSFNTVQQMGESAEADLYCMGHDHKRGAVPMTKLSLRQRKDGSMFLYPRKQLYVRSGSFLLGYKQGCVSYVADKCLNPVDLGGVRIEIGAERINIQTDEKMRNGQMRHDRHVQLTLSAHI